MDQRSDYMLNNKLPASPAQQDIKDIARRIFKSSKATADGETGQQKNKLYNSFFPMAGYTLQTGFAVIVSEGIAFYADTSRYQKISSILTSIAYTQCHQVLFPMLANFWTRHNQFNIVLDYRFIKYPSTTYGLGARTTDDDAYTLNYNYVKLHQTIQAKIYRNLYAGAGIYYDLPLSTDWWTLKIAKNFFYLFKIWLLLLKPEPILCLLRAPATHLPTTLHFVLPRSSLP